MKHQPVRPGQTTTPGTMCPALFGKCVGSLMSPAKHVPLKMTGPTIYSTVLIREDLKHLTICDPILEKVVKGEKEKMRLFKIQTKMCLNTV